MNPASTRLVLQLKALADPVRLRLIALCRQAECSVTELTAVLGASQPRVSQHLKQLVDAALLERYRDGQRVYYRVPDDGPARVRQRRILDLLPDDEPDFARDAGRLRAQRAASVSELTPGDAAETVQPSRRGGDVPARALHRAILDLTVAAPVGDLLDIGCGRGHLLKLLASRANRAVGVDIDTSARDRARAELLLAGVPNCSLRAGDMYRLPFGDRGFDTVILDDVLADAERPADALREARRQLRDGGRLVLLQRIQDGAAAALRARLAAACGDAGLRMAPARLMPVADPVWLLAVAQPQESTAAAA